MTNPQGPPNFDPSAAGGSAGGTWGNPASPTQPSTMPPQGDPMAPSTPKAKKVRRFRLKDPVTIILVVVIVVALVAVGIIGAEIYASHRADTLVANATQCVVQDSADVSFGGSTPFLLQHFNGHYTNISITTAGNQIKNAKEMKAQVNIDDVDLHGTATSKGTIGALDATITWTSNGIKETVKSSVPLLGSFLKEVNTDPSAGTIQLKGTLGSITTKPQVVNNGLGLQIVTVTGLGFTLPKETVQPLLDNFATQLTSQYPLGIHADSVQVTSTGVTAHFSTRNATIPIATQNPCFAGL